MRIAEIFRSRQGEGRLTGVESVFVRVSGCPLRCRFCDTPYASWSPEGEELSVDEIWELVASGQWAVGSAKPQAAWNKKSPRLPVSPSPSLPVFFPGHVVITGGEPMAFEETVALASRFRAAGWHITIETSGTCWLPVACDLMSVSPKLSNAGPLQGMAEKHEKHHIRHAPHVVRRLAKSYDCQWKFVVGSPADCRETLDYLDAFPEIDRRRVMLMPLGVDPAALAATARWLAPYCREHGLVFCPRRQIEWYGNRRGA